MNTDIQILSIVQIALIGILVVLGMFFLWRKIQRLEQKLEALAGQMEHFVAPVAQATAPASASGGAAPSPASQAYSAPHTFEFEELPLEGYTGDDGEDYDDEDEDDEDGEDGLFGLNPEEEAIVQRMFKDGGASGSEGKTAQTAFMVFSPFGFSTSPHPPSAPPVVHIEEEGDGDGEAETESNARLPSKTKLSKMNIEQLKEYLSRHQRSTEGTKKQLFERALETIR